MSTEHTIPLDIFAEGVHVVAHAYRSTEEKEIMMLQIQVYPLPVDHAIIEQLATAARDAINKVLTETGISSGAVTDLSSSGTMQ